MLSAEPSPFKYPLINTVPEHKKGSRQCCDNHNHPQLKTHRLANPLMITLSKILCRKNPCTGDTAKYAKVVDKNQLVYNRHARHLFCANLPYHDIVKQADKISDAILYHDRHRNHQHHPVKIPVPNKF